MKRILLACLVMFAATAAHAQMSSEALLGTPTTTPETAVPEGAGKLFSDAGYYMAILRRCGTPVDMALFKPMLRKFGKQQKLLAAGMLAGQERANALGAFEYVPGSSECNTATAGYNTALTSIQAMMALLPKH